MPEPKSSPFELMMDDRTIDQLRDQTYSDAFTIYGLREALGDFEDEDAIREDERERIATAIEAMPTMTSEEWPITGVWVLQSEAARIAHENGDNS